MNLEHQDWKQIYVSLDNRKQEKKENKAHQSEMVSERIRLSYVDPVRCSQLLNFYGVKKIKMV